MSTIAGLKVHPAAEIFPLLEGDEFARLCDDIKANGLREPIWRVWQDGGLGNGTREAYVLDGRNRLRACERAKIKPEFRDYTEADPVGFVLSLNLHRRHLDESQRAMVAARIATLSNHRPVSTSRDVLMNVPSQPDAAKALNVGVASVQRARSVLVNGVPELAAVVEQGGVSVTEASRVAKLPADEQKDIIALGPQAVKRAAAEIRKAQAPVDTSPRTERQAEIARLTDDGLTRKQVADRLGISPSLVSKDMVNMGLSKSCAHNKIWSDMEHMANGLDAVCIKADQLTEQLNSSSPINATKEQVSACAKSLDKSLRRLRALHAALERRFK